MFRRVIEDHQDNTFFNIENARKYAEQAEKFSKLRYRGFLSKIDELKKKGNYLDVGAGSGTLAAMIAERNKDINITAVEISPIMVTIGNECIENKSLNSNIKFVEGNIEDGKLSEKLGPSKFDLVYSTFSLHHWENPQVAITNLMRYVKDDGVLMIYDLKRVYWLYWIPKQTGFFKSIRASYRTNEIRRILNSIGIKKFEIKSIFPFFMQNIIIWKQ